MSKAKEEEGGLSGEKKKEAEMEEQRSMLGGQKLQVLQTNN